MGENSPNLVTLNMMLIFLNALDKQKLPLSFMEAGRVQGDRIGRFFASWAIAEVLWVAFEKYVQKKLNFFGCFFAQQKFCWVGLVALWAIFFTNSSGHPGRVQQKHPIS
jgi:hypothetical protein